ncbi:hypothetical protein ACVDG8_003535 [Mesorhizobium sp. ORM8.1]
MQLLLWDTTWPGMALQAAVDGAGVLMGHEALVSRALAAGSLVAPFPDRRVPTGLSLSILAPERAPAHAAGEWLLAEPPSAA